MPALPSSLISSSSAAPAACAQVPPSGLLLALGQLPDPRARRGGRHRLATVLAAAVCAVMAGYRSYAAIGEWVADLPVETAGRLGMDPGRRPSKALIRRLPHALDADRLTAVIAGWLAQHRPQTATPGALRTIAVDGKTIRGSGGAGTAARPVLAAADHATGAVLASADVDASSNEITRLRPLSDQIGDLRDTVATVDALHCRRDHVSSLADRGAHWTLTVTGNQPNLHLQLAALPWRAAPTPPVTPTADTAAARSAPRRC